MAGWVGGHVLISRSGFWTTRRAGGAMSRFKNEITHLQAHIKTLRLGAGALVVVALVMGGGWWSAPRDLTIHVPPDLRSGSTRKWWEVPPESVYAFTFYVFQTLNRWPTNGEEDYSRNLHTLSPYLTPSCQAFLRADYDYRRSTGELRQRVRGIYEIPGRGYGDDPTARVRVVSDRDWVVTLDISADEYYGAEQVKRALVRYPIKVTRVDVDPARNPFGLALDCYDGAPQRISAPEPTRPAPAACLRKRLKEETPHEASCTRAAGAAGRGRAPVAQAVEILRWERMPLAVPLKVGQERIVFIDRNVRVGVPAGVGERLRVQSAGGAVYLRASEPIEPTRLQLQDADTGALILLDIAAEPPKDGEAELEPVRIVEGSSTRRAMAISRRCRGPGTRPGPGARRRGAKPRSRSC
jgi:integrating conjugative element protein (TIGR03746 family)